jgi:hypothetical protein
MADYRLEMVARIPRQSQAPLLHPVGELRFNNLTYESKLGAVGALQTSVHVDTLSEPVKSRLQDLLRYPSELWLYRDDKLIYQAFLSNAQLQSSTLVMYSHDFLYYLRYMFIVNDLRFNQADQFHIARTIINQWQNLDYGHFGIGTSGSGNSGVLRDRTYTAAENPNVYTKLQQLSDVINGFDFLADHANRRIIFGYPSLGTDKTETIIFDRRNISSADIQMSVQVEDVASDAYGTGTSTTSDGTDRVVRSHKFDPEVRRLFGRTGIADTFDGVSRQATADRYTEQLLRNRDKMLFTPGPGLRPVGGVDVGDIGAGDKITYSYDAGLGLQTIQTRIVALSISVSDTNAETISVEFA